MEHTFILNDYINKYPHFYHYFSFVENEDCTILDEDELLNSGWRFIEVRECHFKYTLSGMRMLVVTKWKLIEHYE